MAKKTMLSQVSKRFSRLKSNDSIGILNPDTNIIDKEQTFWWRHLEENTFMQYSMMYDDINETTKQLSLNSKLDPSQDDNSKWWKNLNLSHNKHNVSTDSIQNFSAAVMETNVVQKSSSESDKEVNIKKKKLLRPKLNRTSKSNAFLNVLNDETETDILIRSSRKREAASSNSYNNISDKISEKIHRTKEDSSNLSSTANIVKLRPNIFKEKKNRWTNDQNVSRNVLAEDGVLDDTHSAGKTLSASGKFLSKTISPSKKKMGNKMVLDNNSIFDNNTTIQNNEESDDNRKILKPKSRLMNIYAQKSMEKNVFEDAVVQKRNSNLSTHNLNQEINIHDKKLTGSLNTSRDLHNNLSNGDPTVSIERLSKSNYDTKLYSTYNNSKSISKTPESMRREREVRETVSDMSDTINNEQHSKLMKESLNPKKKPIANETATSNVQTIQRNFNPLGDKTNSKTSEQLSSLMAENSNRVETEDRQIQHKRNALRKSQNYHNTASRTSSKDVSFTVGKMNPSKTLRTVENFFKIKQSTVANEQLSVMSSQAFIDAEKLRKINNKLKRIQNSKKVTMKANIALNRVSKSRARSSDNFKQTNNRKLLKNPTKMVDKAFLINGKVYKAPKLPRPKHWVTDRLYKFLWKRMESKYMLATRVQSEKFIQNLARIVTLIQRRKMYSNYKIEVESLMKEMARLEIISTRSDFYNFCQDFLPYDFRVKVVPMLLPGNKKLVPYDPNELHVPLVSNK